MGTGEGDYKLPRNLLSSYDIERDPTRAHAVGEAPYEIAQEIKTERHPYIVEWEGDLLIVVRDGYVLDFVGDYGMEGMGVHDSIDESRVYDGTKEFRVFKFDLSNEGWVEFQDLRDKALFLGDNASISVRATALLGIRPNCIYYTDDCWPAYIEFKGGVRRDTGIYNLEDGSHTPYFKGESFSSTCPPLWVRPYF